MTTQEYEFYQAVRERRAERIEQRAMRRRREQLRAERLDRIGEALLVPAMVAAFYAACIAAFI